jgi:hypothetical protein
MNRPINRDDFQRVNVLRLSKNQFLLVRLAGVKEVGRTVCRNQTSERAPRAGSNWPLRS